MLIDTHCHLDFPQFAPDFPAVISRAKQAGVNFFINIGSTLGSSAAGCILAQKHAEIYACVGVHPHDAESFNQEAESQLRKLAQNAKVVAIGETGLDFYRNLSRPEHQLDAFNKQVKLAQDLHLPIVIHSRQAQEQTIAFLKTVLPLKAVVHCFSGDEKFLRECLDLGLFVSFTCNITYKKAQDLRELVKLTPLDRLMLETDAPYLSPEGFRGQRNEPMQIKLLAEAVSQIKEVSFTEIAEQTSQNAKGFFGLK